MGNKRFNRKDQVLMAVWAADSAKRVLPYYERKHPGDERPGNAIKALRKWIRTGVFSMAEIRKASLDAHAAARKAVNNKPACFAARLAGQAVATAHVAMHAYGAAYYAIKVMAEIDPGNASRKISGELAWQTRQIPSRLRPAWRLWYSRFIPKNLLRHCRVVPGARIVRVDR